MIDPKNITKYNRTEAELEELIVFAVLVAGKNSSVQAKKLNLLLCMSNLYGPPVPNNLFKTLKKFIKQNELDFLLKYFAFGQYKRLNKCFSELVKYEGKLSQITAQELMSIYGISSKTANFFLLHSRKDHVGAVLDTHILKWIRKFGYDAPKTTPPPKKYKHWEKIFLDLCHDLWPNKSIADIDLMIWKEYNQKTT